MGSVDGVLAEADDRTLVQRARQDPDAFAQLYRRHVDRIHAFAWRRSGSRQMAEDVTAATFERAWAGLDRFEWRGGGVVPWLFQIAANELTAQHRRDRRADTPRAQAAMAALAAPGGGLDGDGLDYVLDQWPAVRSALDTLPTRYQEAITLRYLAGLSADDCAAALGCSKPNFAVVLHRAMKALGKTVDKVVDR